MKDKRGLTCWFYNKGKHRKCASWIHCICFLKNDLARWR